MATKISTELLIIILNNVKSIQDLYSSLLVNRFWCKVTIPILWELVLDQEFNWDNLRNKALCIRTYVSCMDTQARTLLTRNGFDLSSSPPQATFDYPSFTHKLRINNLAYFNSEYFDSSQVPENYSHDLNYNDLIGSIIKLPGVSKSESQVQLLEKLISVQNLSIIGNVDFYHFEEKSSPIGQFTSFKKLYIEYCLLYKSDSLFFASSITQLRDFHLAMEKGLDANYLLCKWPKVYRFRMGMFRSESLRKIFEVWIRKGGGRNKKIIVKLQSRLFTLSDEHFKVIDEYGNKHSGSESFMSLNF
ncbi:7573_t:CDS:2 [Diversispora eburnea]|uniref:7573_t:CDS:1 n=1 Tax=Diversispora eburnea TaxID=1213867 RepID=A0A9N9G2E6_9GLOM|nr:7573_t:CDS:2 [Diversispora eburnea]